jgi:hypothetical protein
MRFKHMSKAPQLKNAEEYDPLIAGELVYYRPLAADAGVSEEVLLEAAKLGVRDAIHTHRASPDCRNREEECVTYNIRHFIDMTLVRACLMAASEDDMDKAERVLMRLIED